MAGRQPRKVDDWIFDDITRKFVLDDDMHRFFEANTSYALEAIGRRLLEDYERGLRDADPDVIEGRIDRCGDGRGFFWVGGG